MKDDLAVVSVVIPVKRSQHTIRQTVDSLLAQDYPGDLEIIVVGDYQDPSWAPLYDLIEDQRVIAVEAQITGPGRDSNAKRNLGLGRATGEIIALTDGDIVLPPDWIRTGVSLVNDGWDYISGSVRSMDDGFWGGYMDNNQLGNKIPDITDDYVLDSVHFGENGLKPPVTGNTFVTRAVILNAGGLDSNFVTSYEDYEWARRVVDHGHKILRTGSLVVKHYHRKGFKGLIREHHRSGYGCGDYIRKHSHCQFGKLRLKQLMMVYLMAAIGVVAIPASVLFPVVPVALLTAIGILGMFSAWKTKSMIGMVYPLITLVFGLAFSVGLTRRLFRGAQTPHETRVLSSSLLSTQPNYALEDGS